MRPACSPAVLMALALVAACSTPYQPMGWKGGYRDRQVSSGTYMVEVRVNGYTSAGTALEYLYRRAGELCGEGNFEVKSETSGASRDYVVSGGFASEINKPHISAIVECGAPAAQVAGAPGSVDPAPRQPFYCTTATEDSTQAACARTREHCARHQRTFAAAGVDVGPCAEVDVAICFDFTSAEGKRLVNCFPTMLPCTRVRQQTIDGGKASDVTECRDVAAGL